LLLLLHFVVTCYCNHCNIAELSIIVKALCDDHQLCFHLNLCFRSSPSKKSSSGRDRHSSNSRDKRSSKYSIKKFSFVLFNSSFLIVYFTTNRLLSNIVIICVFQMEIETGIRVRAEIVIEIPKSANEKAAHRRADISQLKSRNDNSLKIGHCFLKQNISSSMYLNTK